MMLISKTSVISRFNNIQIPFCFLAISAGFLFSYFLYYVSSLIDIDQWKAFFPVLFNISDQCVCGVKFRLT